MATLEQKIAQKQDELARLKERQRKLENGRKNHHRRHDVESGRR